MTLLHMETDVVREMANTLRQISQEIDYKIQDVSRSANNMDWVSPARDELVSDIQRLTSMVSAKTDEAITLSDRVHREVSEWEQAASSFLGGDSVQIGNPLIGGGGGGGGGAGGTDYEKIEKIPDSIRILLKILEKMLGVAGKFSNITSLSQISGLLKGAGIIIAGVNIGINIANAWNDPKYGTIEEKLSAAIVEFAFGVAKAGIKMGTGLAVEVFITGSLTAGAGPLGLILGNIVGKLAGIAAGELAGKAFELLATDGVKAWCIAELLKLGTGAP